MKFTLNGNAVDIDVPPNLTLLNFLRDTLEITSPKVGCDEGECGTCTVLLNGEPVNSCLVLAAQVENQEITTLEGLEKNGNLDIVQQTFLDHYGSQCGFCTPGMILASKSLLDRNPTPTEEDIKEALEGNICRCTGYQQIIESVLKAAELRAR
jgi:carbon-monoxide dehydrogenase small subunit|tara:strand:- start:585 stop:1043 length:459 start_codon:yes stop_codon:yes gene_type:complete